MRHAALVLPLLASVAVAAAQDPSARATTPRAVRAAIEEIRAPAPPWRGVPWQTCLLDGIRESRRSKKPMILWIFIDRPVDDARC